MKWKNFLLYFFIGLCANLSAQTEDCGDIPSSAAAQAYYPLNSNFENCDVLIKLYYHLYYDSNGNNGVPANRPDDMTARLNNFYAGTGITFFHNNCETRIVNDNVLDNSLDQCLFFFQNTAHDDGLDIHVKDDNNGFRGVASGIPGGELFMSGTWNGFNVPVSLSQTYGHEVGHCLGLFHTHHGTCTETGGGCLGNGGDPTQSAANGDYVDDTPRDPLLSGAVDANCNWNGNVVCDDNMGPYTPATDNFMAYTRLTCRDNFTMGQVVRMCELMLPEIVHTSTFACCLIEDVAPQLSEDLVYNKCPDEHVDLSDFFIGTIPNETQLVWSEDNDPSNGITQLSNTVVTESGLYYAYFYNVDNDCYSQVSLAIEVIIEECCTDPIPDYIIVDYNGNPKTDFCVGEPVFINACGSIDATSYFLAVWEYELGGYAAGADNVGYSRIDPSWSGTAPGCLISLDDVWANFENYEFRAGHEYRVQFAVDNECTTSWHGIEDGIFTMAFPTPDYLYVDANGNPKNEFCLGETVYLDGSGSLDENRYFLSIWQYNIGGLNAGEDNLGYSRLDPSWAQGEVGSLINLNEIWSNFEQDYFEPGFEYRVQLAVRGECSYGWNVKEDELFTVVCCDEVSVCEAGFTVDTKEDEEGNISFTFNGSDEIYYDHTWTVLQHDVQGTGPYTPVTESNDPNFEFSGTIGGCYTIVHEVETPCGNCCYSREICNDNEGEGESRSSADCDILCNLTTPSGLSCNVNNGYLSLTWDDIPEASGYTVSLIFNDPDCCGGTGNPNNPYTIDTEENSVTLQLFPLCMSWTVTAKCDDDKGETSAKKCFNYFQGCSGHDGEPVRRSNTVEDIPQEETTISVYPNPSKGFINYDLHLGKDDVVERIMIVDLTGKIVDEVILNEPNDKTISGSHQLQNTLSGVYFMRIQFENKVINKKIMILN